MRTFIAAAAIALLVSVAVLICLLWQPACAAPAAERSASFDAQATHSSATAAAAQAADARAAAASSDAPTTSSVVAAPSVDEPDARAEAPLADAEELWIVERASDAVVAGADVRFVDFDADTLESCYPRYGAAGIGRLARYIDEHGRAFTTDARGVARLPHANGQGIALARKGELFGLWWFDARDERPWTLALEPDQDWSVRVRDADGNALPDLALTLDEIHAQPQRARTLQSLRTDEHGVARIEHARWLLANAAGERFALTPRALLREPASIALEGRVPPREPSVLVLPRLGLIEVLLRTSDGAAWVPPTTRFGTRIELANASLPERNFFDDPRASLGVERALDGRWTAYVELGLDVRAALDFDMLNGALTAQQPGPRSAFERVEIPLVVGSTHPLLRLRARDEHGTPLSNARIAIHVRSLSAFGAGTFGEAQNDPTTDARGGLELALGRANPGAHTVLTLRTRREPRIEARVALPEPLADGVLDLGDVAFARAPRAIGGTVVDARGEPIAGACVTIDGMPPANERASHAELTALLERQGLQGKALDSMLAHQAQLLAQDPFLGGPNWKLFTDEHGRFELRTFERCERLRVSARTDELPQTPRVEAAPAAPDLRIELAEKTSVAGRVLLPDFLAPADLRVQIQRERNAADSGRAFPQPNVTLGADGAWSIDGLDAGRWSIRVMDAAAFAWEPLVPATAFECVPGRRVVVPDIDVRGALRKLEIRVLDERGAPLPRAIGTFHAPGNGNNNDIEVRDGRARILTAHARIDAAIGQAGWRVEHVDDLRDGATVRMRDALRVRVRLRAPAALPSKRYELDVQLDPRRGGDSFVLGEISRTSFSALDAAHEAVLQAAVVGKHWVTLAVRDSEGVASDGSPRREALQLASAPELDVRESDAEQVFEVDVDAAALNAAIERLDVR